MFRNLFIFYIFLLTLQKWNQKTSWQYLFWWSIYFMHKTYAQYCILYVHLKNTMVRIQKKQPNTMCTKLSFVTVENSNRRDYPNWFPFQWSHGPLMIPASVRWMKDNDYIIVWSLSSVPLTQECHIQIRWCFIVTVEFVQRYHVCLPCDLNSVSP